MTHYFTSFSTVFQSYQDNEMLIMKGCEQRNLGYGGEDFGCVYGGGLEIDQQAPAIN